MKRRTSRRPGLLPPDPESGARLAGAPGSAVSPAQRHAGPGWWGCVLLVAFAILFFGLVRARLRATPLERDEGEYAYAGQLILQGIPPYELAYNMKFPGTYYSYAAIMAAFGQTAAGIRLGLALINAASTLLVFAIGRRLCGNLSGAIAAATFALLSIDRSVLGTFAHATHFVMLPALAALFLLLRALERPKAWPLAASGALFGVAVLMKQHALVFLLLGVFLVLRQSARRQPFRLTGMALPLGALGLGAMVPFSLMCVLFWVQGVLDSFWFWTFQYAREYVSEVPLSQALTWLVQGLGDVTQRNLIFWLAAMGGLCVLWMQRWEPTVRVFLTGLLVASFVTTVPGLYFRQHYFITVLPAIALLTGVAFVSLGRALEGGLGRGMARAVAIGLFAAAALTYVVLERDYLFRMTPRELSRSSYGINPFIEAVEVAKYIRERTSPQDDIAVIGSEPEIYFYAGRRSSTGYIYTYALLEPQRYARRMREEMIGQVEAAYPKYLVYSRIPSSWLPTRLADLSVLDWADRYTEKCYELAGVADIFSRSQTRYVWNGQAQDYQPASTLLVYVFRRNRTTPCTSLD